MDIPALHAALGKLDPQNDGHWTADGQPRLDTVKMLAGNPAVTRDQVELAAPGYLRGNAGSYTMQPPAAPPAPPASESAPPVAAGAAVAPLAPVVAAEPVQGDNGDGTFSNAKTEPGQVVPGLGHGEDDLPSLETQLAEATARTEEVRKALDYVNAQLAKALAAEDTIREQMVISPKEATSDAIRAYLDKQADIRNDRMVRREMITTSGIDLVALARNLKAPIDAAMSRKTGRGGQRPALQKI